MKKVIILQGLPASGKSSFARQILDDNKGMYKRLNKDELRAMLDNKHHSTHNERFVERVRDMMLLEALKDGKHVIIDDTNLSERPIERIKNTVKAYCKAHNDQVSVEVRSIDTPLQECLARDAQRPDAVGRDVILRMYQQKVFGNTRGPHYLPQDDTLPKAIICDLDGTLAIIHDRSPFDGLACGSDRLNEPVARLVRTYRAAGLQVLMMSGRQDEARAATENWLKAHDLPYDALLMRATGDSRKDALVKKDLYEQHVRGRYFVEMVLDDRNQVVDLWRLELGLPCMQVNYGDF